jgi:hypothetical protein
VPELSTELDSEGMTTFAVYLENEGPGSASNLMIEVSAGEKTIGRHEIDFLESGEDSVSKMFRIPSDMEEALVIVDYMDFSKGKEGVKNRESLRLAGSAVLPENERMFSNPYVVDDRALKVGEPFVGRRHREILEELKQLIQEETGGVFNLWGSRRFGKTSLLNKLMGEIDASDCISVYISSLYFDREKISWARDEFLATLAWLMMRRLKEQGIDCEDCWNESFGESEQDVSSRSRPAVSPFYEFIRAIKRSSTGVEKKLVLLFDDADIFFEQLPQGEGHIFPLEEFKKVLDMMNVYSSDPQLEGFFAIFATDIAFEEWMEVRVSAGSKQLTMFERDDLDELMNWDGVPLNYSPLAKEYFWRVTGGHPALTQLACAYVINEWVREGQTRECISLPLVKRTVKGLAEDAHLRGYFRYLYRYSIPPRAREVLEKLVREDRIDTWTLRVQLDEQDIRSLKSDLDVLKDQQILLERDGRLYLRNGFFYLLLDTYLMER